MDYRTEAFLRKFGDAARHLSVRPDQIVSLKLRENVNSYAEYGELLHELEHAAGLRYAPVDGDLQGQGYLISHGKAKIIVVEHEAGLEILYIAGSIASLISLVPLVLQGWRALRSRHARHESDVRNVEIRRLDSKGRISEEHFHDMAAFAPLPGGFLNAALASAAKLVEVDLGEINNQLHSLTLRVEALEKVATVGPRGRKTRPAKKNAPQQDPASPDARLAHLVKKP